MVCDCGASATNKMFVEQWSAGGQVMRGVLYLCAACAAEERRFGASQIVSLPPAREKASTRLERIVRFLREQRPQTVASIAAALQLPPGSVGNVLRAHPLLFERAGKRRGLHGSHRRSERWRMRRGSNGNEK